MNGYLARRVAKLEDRRRAPVFVPNVVECREGETADEAIGRFQDRYGAAVSMRRHAVLVIPTWPTIDAFAASLKAQQAELIDWVRSQHPKEAEQC
jgi:hypothetical protein